MKFQITPTKDGVWLTAAGRRVSITPATHGAEFADTAAAAAHYQLTRRVDAIAKAEQVAAAEKIFADTVAAGYTDPDTGITLSINDHDRTQFSQYREHLTAKGVPDAAVIGIADTQGVPHQLTFGEFRALMVRMGDYYLHAWQVLLVARNTVVNA